MVYLGYDEVRLNSCFLRCILFPVSYLGCSGQGWAGCGEWRRPGISSQKAWSLSLLHSACCVLRSLISFCFDHGMCQELSFPGQRWVESSLGTLTSSQEERLKDTNKGDFLTHGLVQSMLTDSTSWLGASNQVFHFPTFIHNK